MRYNFKDLFNDSMYNTANVIIIAGQYQIFNNIVIDKCKELCKSRIDNINASFLEDLIADLPTTESSIMDSGSNTVTLESFMELNKAAPIDGRWFCRVNYEQLNAKEKDKVKEYFKLNTRNGLLVVNITKWLDYREFLKNRIIGNHKSTHIIQLSFPTNAILKQILTTHFSQAGFKVTDNALELFILRMSNAYDQYSESLDIVCNSLQGEKTIDYEKMKDAMSGIENYVIDDFIIQLTKRMGSSKIVTSRKIYKMYKSLYENMGPVKLVNTLRNKIDVLIELRYLINIGVIPIKVRYSVTEVKERLKKIYPEIEDTDETEKTKKKSTKKKLVGQTIQGLTPYTFKKYARISALTSLRDWYYIKLMLYNNDTAYLNDNQAEKILLSIMHRTTFSPSRLINDIGVDNIVYGEMFELNAVLFNPFVNRFDPELKIKMQLATEAANKRSVESKYEEVILKKATKKSKSPKIKDDITKEAAIIQEILNNYTLN